MGDHPHSTARPVGQRRWRALATGLVAAALALTSLPAHAETAEERWTGVTASGLGSTLLVDEKATLVATNALTNEAIDVSLIGHGCNDSAWTFALPSEADVVLRAEFPDDLVLYYDGTSAWSRDADDARVVDVEGYSIDLDVSPELLVPAPAVSGRAEVGQTLAVSTPDWSAFDRPNFSSSHTSSYQWLRDGMPIDGATASEYVLAEADAGQTVSARVTGRLWDCIDVPVTSEVVSVAETPAPSEEETPAGDDLAETGGTPSAPAQSSLTEGNRGDVVVPATVTAGEQARVFVGRELTGQTVHGWLFSTPTSLGAATVAADGTVSFTIPTDVPAGAHRVAVQDASGALLGWGEITVSDAVGAEPLAATGAAESLPALLLAAGLLLAGAVLVAYRRTARG